MNCRANGSNGNEKEILIPAKTAIQQIGLITTELNKYNDV